MNACRFSTTPRGGEDKKAKNDRSWFRFGSRAVDELMDNRDKLDCGCDAEELANGCSHDADCARDSGPVTFTPRPKADEDVPY